MHKNDLVFIGCLYQRRAGVAADPSLLLADVQQYGVYAFLGRGTGVEVVGEDFMEVLAAVVDHHLFTVEVGVAEGRSHVDNGPRRVVVGDVHDAALAGQIIRLS